MRQASSTTVPDTTSGFRAYNREAALAIQVVSKFTYTLETIIQAGKMLVAIDHVPVRTNPQLRESRLFPSTWTYIRRNGLSIFRDLRDVRAAAGVPDRRAARGLVALAVWGRFAWFFVQGDGAGHVQSLILGAVLFNAAMVLAAMGVLGDLLSGQRITLQRIFERDPAHGARARRAALPLRAGRQRQGARRRARRTTARPCAVSTAVTRDAEGTVTGNTYDKYGSPNPVVRRLMARFERDLGELFERAAPPSVLDVGCGEGVLTQRWAAAGRRARGGHRPRGSGAAGRVGGRRAPNLEFRMLRAERLPFGDGEFALASAIEVLEHVPDPEHAVAEMARVARGGRLLVSVPREPLWRALNMARGAYLRELGNTPGHLNHWSRRAFVALLSRHGRSWRCARRSRGRCCSCACRRLRGDVWRAGAASARRPRRPNSSYGRGARVLASGSRRPGSSRSRTSRSPATR